MYVLMRDTKSDIDHLVSMQSYMIFCYKPNMKELVLNLMLNIDHLECCI